MASSRPNVLLIMSDQHHAGILGCAGDEVVQTPHLDRLAAEGAHLPQTYCPFPLCCPSRMAFMAANPCHRIDVWDNTTELRSDVATFAHGFTAAGYRTILSGRMHFVGADQRHGFQERIASDCGPNAYLQTGWRLGPVLGDLIDTPGCDAVGVRKSGPGHSGYQAYDEYVTDRTVQWLQQQKTAPSDEPWMMTVGLVLPHCPFVAPPDDFAYYADRIGLDDLPRGEASLHPVMQHWRQSCQLVPPPSPEHQWATRVAYYGMCTHMDRLIGRMLEALDDAGVADETIVVYTSDHGEQLGEHGLWWKSSFYDGSARVPLLVRWPDEIAPDTVCHRNANLIDIGPTLLALAGLDPLPGVEGRSFATMLRDGDDPAWDDVTFAELYSGGPHGPVAGRMIRRGPWKYNYYHGEAPELYNLDDDPGEHSDRADSPACHRIAEELRARVLADWDPDHVLQRQHRQQAQRPLIRDYLLRVRPLDPEPVWFDEPPANEILPFTAPTH